MVSHGEYDVFLQHAEILEGFPLANALIFTDGSYSTPQYQPRPRAAGSVILLSATGEVPPIAFYLSDGAVVLADSAPTMELIALYAAILLREHLNHPVPIYSDSKTSLDKLTAPLRLLDPKVAGYPFAHHCHVLLRKSPGPLYKVAAHPEKRAKSTEWDILMWGNHMADRVASGGDSVNLLGKAPGMPTTQLTATDIPVETLTFSVCTQTPFYWALGGGRRATTACSPYPHLGRIALMRYTQCREQYSADIGRNRDWEFVSSAFAARCWSLTALSLKGSKGRCPPYYLG
jgi:hypothetical protein